MMTDRSLMNDIQQNHFLFLNMSIEYMLLYTSVLMFVKILQTKVTVDSRYLEIEGTLRNSSRYPYFDISDL